MSENAQELQQIYRQRFEQTAAYRNRVWQLLTAVFFNRWIPTVGHVLDLGCGYDEFINNIGAGKKYAMDLNPDAPRHLVSAVSFFEQDCSMVWPLPDNSLDTVFKSIFFNICQTSNASKKPCTSPFAV